MKTNVGNRKNDLTPREAAETCEMIGENQRNMLKKVRQLLGKQWSNIDTWLNLIRITGKIMR